MDLYERFSDEAHELVIRANEEAAKYHCDYLSTEHFLLGMLNMECNGVYILRELDVPMGPLEREIRSLIYRGGDKKRFKGTRVLTPRLKMALGYSNETALRLGHEYTGTEHILLGLAKDPDGVAGSFLKQYLLDESQMEALVLDFLERRNRW